VSASAPRGHPRLEIDDPLGRRVALIDKPVFQLGRRTESDVRSVEGDVSREHAKITLREDGAYILSDRGSRSGTFVNSERVTEHPLEHRDRIRLGRSASTEPVFLLGDATDSQGTHSSGIVGFKQPCHPRRRARSSTMSI